MRTILIGLFLVGFLAPVLAAPANDHFADAQAIPPSETVTLGSNVGATKEQGEPQHAFNAGGRSAWWSYTPEEKGFLTVSTVGSRSTDGYELDTVLSIYTGNSLALLTVVAWNDDDEESDSLGSKVIFPVEQGVRYYIAVDGYGFQNYVDEGSIILRTLFSFTLPTRQAPGWNLPSIDGATVGSTNFSGQVTLVNFWATWCGPCIEEIPDLVALQGEYERFGFTVIGISIDDAAANQPPTTLVRNFAQQHRMNYPVVMSRPRSTVEDDFGNISAIPTTFLIDRENNIVQRVVGSHNKAFFEALVRPYVLNSVPVTIRSEAGNSSVEWPTVPGAVRLEQSTSLESGAWTAVNAAVSRGESVSSVLLPRSAGQAFYRLAIL